MNDFVDRIRKSSLVDSESLRQALKSFSGDRADKLEFARYLIRRDLLTKWQCQQILEGRYKGFFLGKYKLLETLGRGGMSMVYVAEHTGMQRKVAVKVLPKSRTNDASFLERFRREARALAALTHPQIVRAYDFDCHDDTYYLVMELVDGRSLRDLVTQEHPLNLLRIVELIAQAADGLQCAHDAGFVHRDVKPANILVDRQDQVKILDLGLAMLADAEQSSVTLVNNEKVLGTADYLAPEQALNSHDVDWRADIYALGGTLYFTLTALPPYPTGSIAQKIAQHQSAAVPDPRVIRSDCPTRLADLCIAMLQKSPQDRPKTATHVAKQLRVCLNATDSGKNSTRDPNDTFDWSTVGDSNRVSTIADKLKIDLTPELTSLDMAVGRESSRPGRRTLEKRVFRRRRSLFPWWMWSSIVGLLLAAGWLMYQISRR